MADDFQSCAADLLAGVLNTHPSTAGFLKAAMVRQLGNLQPEVVPWMEKSGSFSTVAGQATYTAADTGFPKSLLRFERLGYDMGNYLKPIQLLDMQTIRSLQEHPAAAYAWRCAWWEDRLQFGPAPAGAYTVKWDATLDSTKDTATGALLTVASTTQTNAWFLVPWVTVLKHLAWADYYQTSPDQRPDMAQSHQGLAQAALMRLRDAGAKREAMNSLFVTPSAYGGYGRESKSDWVSRFFPGAPA